MPTRRDLFRSLPLISLAPTVPGFLARLARGAEPARDDRVLVVIQLEGGNDGINTVVPIDDDGYARNRSALRLAKDRLVRVVDGVGLHPAMGDAGKLLESGRLAIVPGVGYPNPSRSHFASMATWQTARFDPEDQKSAGWLGRALDLEQPREVEASALFVGSGHPPTALLGRKARAASLERIEDLRLENAPQAPRASSPASGDDLADFVRRGTLDAYATADRLAELARGRDDSARYPATGLASRLKLVARLLKGGFRSRVFYTTQAGYDTHNNQLATHAELLDEFSGAIKAFLDDLASAKLADRVLVLAFSEFGRRVAENGSSGTDHGTAGPVFLAGPTVKPGLAGPYPSLGDLEGGDLKMSLDFRRVYATALGDWLGLPSELALGGRFEPLPLLKG